MPSDEGVRIGPSGKPQHSLAEEIAAWCYEWLRQPDGPNAGDPWTFTNEQYRFLAQWYAVDDQGRWLFRRGTLRRMKGWGKDPVGAVLCSVEAFGPCRFSHFEHGKPVATGNRAGWVQVAAVSRDQTRTTMRLFPGLIPKSTRDRFGIEVHKEIVHIDGGRSVIEAITSSPLSAEGPRASFVLRNEVQNWLSSNEGHEMAEVIDGNLAKSRDGSARALSLCNAHVPGTDSIGEREWEAYQAIVQGKSRASGVLYDSLEAPPDTDMSDRESLECGLRATRGDAEWLDIDRIINEIWDPRTTPSEARRKYLNQLVAAEDAWVAPHEWDRLALDSKLEAKEEITLGFDGSKSDDHSALVACRAVDSHLVTLNIWDPSVYDDGEVPRGEIDAAVRQAFERYDVVGFYSDYHPWESYVDSWERELADKLCVSATQRYPIRWDLRGRQREATQMAEAFHDAIVEGDLSHSGDKRANQHVYNARRRPNQYGVTFGKEHRESARKVDWTSAAMLARKSRQDYMALPESKRRRKKTGRAMFAG